MSLVQIDWQPDRRKLRTFGLIILTGFGLLGAGFWFGWPFPQNTTVGLILLVGGHVAGLMALTGSKAALPFYWFWMGLAFVSGNIVSRVILALFYYSMITAMAIAGRVLGRDKLLLKRTKGKTYWVDLDHVVDPARYERQF